MTNELLYGYQKNGNIKQYDNYEILIKQKFDNGYEKGLIEVKKFILGDIFKYTFENDKGRKRNMRFDVMIGNPPYSDSEARGEVGSGNALYPHFMAMGTEIADFSSLVVPSGWMIQYPTGTKHEIIDNLRKSKKYVELHDFEDENSIFDGVSIPTGVCYYLFDNSKDEEEHCRHFIKTRQEPKEKEIINQPLYDENAGVIFRDPVIIDIKGKIKEIEGDNFKSFADTCAGAKHYFDDGEKIMTSKWTGYSSIRNNDYNIMYFLKSSNKAHKDSCMIYPNSSIPNLGYGWVNKGQIPKNANDYKKHKIIVGQAFTAGSQQVMDIPQYVGNNSICSQSYVPIFSPHNTEEECLNICKYIKTRFFRYLVNALKAGQNLGNRVYALVPTLDFMNNSKDIDWSQPIFKIDEQLYKRYGIEKYADYIQEQITPME